MEWTHLTASQYLVPLTHEALELKSWVVPRPGLTVWPLHFLFIIAVPGSL